MVTLKRALKFLPKKEELQQHRWLRFLHGYMHHPWLWEFRRGTTVKAVAIGVFMAMMPMPFQMVPASILAVFLRANLLLSVGLVWISNPVTMIPMWYGGYRAGCWLFGQTPLFSHSGFSINALFAHGHEVFLPLIGGCIVVGLIAGLSLATLVWLLFRLLGGKLCRYRP